VAPVAELVAKQFWSTTQERTQHASAPTHLTQKHRREAKGISSEAMAPVVPRTDNICPGCGKTIQDRSASCARCAVDDATKNMLNGARIGRLTANGPAAQAKRAIKARKNAFAQHSWKEIGPTHMAHPRGVLPENSAITIKRSNVCHSINDWSHRLLKQTMWMKYPLAEHLITVFDGPDLDQWIPLYDQKAMIGGVEVYPLVAGVRLLNINSWQYWRGMHPPFFPALNLLVKDASVAHDTAGWFYESKGRRLFEGRDWRIGNLERTSEGAYELTGQYALCDPGWLNGYLETTGLRLAHVLRVSVFQRNREYEDAKEFHNCRLLNLGSVVT